MSRFDSPRRRGRTIASGLTLLLALVLPAFSQSPRTLSLEALEISPEAPGRASLCELVVVLANHGSDDVSRFAFEVEIDGRREETYERALFLVSVPTGETRRVRLHNFWTGDGETVSILVRLTEATRERTVRSADRESRIPLGPAAGLPIETSQRLPLDTGSGR